MPATPVDPEAAVIVHAADASLQPASDALLGLMPEEFLLVRSCTRSAACQTERVLAYPVIGGTIRDEQLVYRRDYDPTLEYKIEAEALAIAGLADYHPGASLNGDDLEFLNGSDSPAPFLFTAGGTFIFLAPSVTARAGDLAEVSFTVAYEGADFDAARSGRARIRIDPLPSLLLMQGDSVSIDIEAFGSAGLTLDWSATGLPSGIALTESGYTAQLAGTATAAGSGTVSITVEDVPAAVADTITFPVTVLPNVDLPAQSTVALTSTTLHAALLADVLADVLESSGTFGRPVRVTPFNGSPTSGGTALWSPLTVSAWEITPTTGSPGARTISPSAAFSFPATSGSKSVTHLRLTTDAGTVIADFALASTLSVPAATPLRIRPGRIAYSLEADHDGSALTPTPAAIFLARLFGLNTDLGEPYVWLEYHIDEPSNASSLPVAATTIERTAAAWNISGSSAVTATNYQPSETAPPGGWTIFWRAIRLAYPSAAPALLYKDELSSAIDVDPGTQIGPATITITLG
jgi:hypothetical protein